MRTEAPPVSEFWSAALRAVEMASRRSAVMRRPFLVGSWRGRSYRTRTERHCATSHVSVESAVRPGFVRGEARAAATIPLRKAAAAQTKESLHGYHRIFTPPSAGRD